MSIQVVAWVLESSDAVKASRLVLLSLANHADSDGTKAFPAVATMAREARMSERSVQYALRQLEGDGHIQATGKTRTGTVVYTVLMGGAKSAPLEGSGDAVLQRGGAKTGRVGVQTTAPEPSLEPSLEPSFGANAPMRAQARVGGKVVKKEAWDMTERVLAEFNQQTGREYRLVTSGGDMSVAASYIYQRIKSYPDLSFEDHQRIISLGKDIHYWGEGKAEVRHVYGPKIFESNIARKPQATEKSRQQQREDERWAAVMAVEGIK